MDGRFSFEGDVSLPFSRSLFPFLFLFQDLGLAIAYLSLLFYSNPERAERESERTRQALHLTAAAVTVNTREKEEGRL